MPMSIVVNTELVDWRVGDKVVEDAPERHWPVKLRINCKGAYKGTLHADITRSDGSVLEVGLELEDGVLAIRAWITDAQGEWVDGGEPVLNVKIKADNTVESLVE